MVFITSDETQPMTGLPRPALLPGGEEPEGRVVVCGLSWERYLAYDKELGDDRPGPRFYYLDEELEIMTTSSEHERIKKWIAGFMDIVFEEMGIEVMPRGQATMRAEMSKAGAEPDESWCVGGETALPNLVLEIALTGGGVRKLEIYRRFGIAEVWIWRKEDLEVHALRTDRSGYERASKSRLLPSLEMRLLARCAVIRSWQEARRAFRAGLAGG